MMSAGEGEAGVRFDGSEQPDPVADFRSRDNRVDNVSGDSQIWHWVDTPAACALLGKVNVSISAPSPLANGSARQAPISSVRR
jgi:hypothetical protein